MQFCDNPGHVEKRNQQKAIRWRLHIVRGADRYSGTSNRVLAEESMSATTYKTRVLDANMDLKIIASD